MRELKFRIWSKFRGIFVVYGDSPLGLINDASVDLELPIMLNESGNVWQQFTGLTDKNGIEIWEGDIVFAPANSSKYTVQLGKYFCYNHRDEEDYHCGFHLIRMNHFTAESIGDGKDVEVIGNIYQDKELLCEN